MDKFSEIKARWSEEDDCSDDFFDIGDFMGRVERTTIILSALLIAGAFLFYKGEIAGGVVVGCMVGLLNFIVLRWIALRVVANPEGGRSGHLLFLVAKFWLIIGLIYVLVVFFELNALAVMTGYSSWMIAVVFESISRVLRVRSAGLGDEGDGG